MSCVNQPPLGKRIANGIEVLGKPESTEARFDDAGRRHYRSEVRTSGGFRVDGPVVQAIGFSPLCAEETTLWEREQRDGAEMIHIRWA